MKICLYCGESVVNSRMPFCYPCRRIIEKMCWVHKGSSFFNLLDLLAFRGENGVYEIFPILDDWQQLGLIECDEYDKNYRRLTNRGYELYQWIMQTRARRLAARAVRANSPV